MPQPILIASNLKLIKSGNIPTTANLPEGHIAFGMISEDSKYHIYGNANNSIIDLTKQFDSMSKLNFEAGIITDGMLISPKVLSEIIAGITSDANERFEAIETVADSHIVMPEWDSTDYKFKFTAQDGTTLTVDLPLELIGLGYDTETDEVIFTDANGTTVRKDISHLIDIYTGSTGDQIQITVQDNEIAAILRTGTVGVTHLTAELQTRLDDADSAITTLQGRVTANDALIATLQADLATAINTLNTAIGTAVTTHDEDADAHRNLVLDASQTI